MSLSVPTKAKTVLSLTDPKMPLTWCRLRRWRKCGLSFTPMLHCATWFWLTPISLLNCIFLSSIWHSQPLSMSPKYQTGAGEARKKKCVQKIQNFTSLTHSLCRSPHGVTKIGHEACFEQRIHTCNPVVYAVWTGEYSRVWISVHQITTHDTYKMQVTVVFHETAEVTLKCL